MQLSTLLNKEILIFYMCKPNQQTLINVEKYFYANKVINFEEIAKLLLGKEGCKKIEDLANYKYEDYARCYQQLYPIYIQIGHEGIEIDCLHLQWLGKNFSFLYENLKNNNVNRSDIVTATVEHILLLTSMLENALANVYYSCTQGRRAPPHLLRDLLSTQELIEVFGLETIIFLKVLLGAPLSINLRNIVWHGFPQPMEIPQYYVNVLLLTIHTLGFKLQDFNFKLQERTQIENFAEFLTKFNCENVNTTILSVDDEAYQTLSNCQWLKEEYKIYWLQLFQYYNDKNYYKFVILILAQIELLLRLIYAHVNDYDVSAKLNEYYITMDTIFEVTVPLVDTAAVDGAVDMYKKNKLYSNETTSGVELEEGAFKYMYDLFVAPNGPRLRDKVSHGEVTMNAINNVALCRILLHLSLNLLSIRSTNKHSNSSYSLSNYESRFHLNCLTKDALNVTKMRLKLFCSSYLKTVELQFIDIDCKVMNIFQRPKKESELMNLILKISGLLTETCINYSESINERQTLLDQRELHSKRRRTLEKILITLPKICGTISDILKSITIVFIKMQQSNSDDSILCDIPATNNLLRFLKHTLKICENLAKYSDKNSNEWIKAVVLSSKFYETRKHYMVKSINIESDIVNE